MPRPAVHRDRDRQRRHARTPSGSVIDQEAAPASRLAEAPARHPVPEAGRRDLQTFLARLVHPTRLERGPQVLGLGGDLVEGPALVGSPPSPVEILQPPAHPGPVARSRGVLLARLPKTLETVLAHRLDHPVAVMGQVEDDHRPVDQIAEQSLDVVALDGWECRHGLGRPEREPAGEDAQPPPQDALGIVQEVVAPTDRAPQRPLPFRRGGAVRAEVGKVAGHPLGELNDPEVPHAGRGELDRERHPVEAGAKVGHGGPQVPAQHERW
jgi:hypothetical protein